MTPYGVSDFVPEETTFFQEKIQILKELFEQHHYRSVKTPTLEYYDTLSSAMGDYLKEQAIKFVDRSGHLLILRPDHTTPIARMVATRMAETPRPLRLCYFDSVFRLKTGELCDAVERFQVGAECIGISGVQAELETILLCIRCLEAMGLTGLSLALGHVSFTKGLSMEEKEALLNKDYTILGALPDRGDATLFSAFPDLQDLTSQLQSQLISTQVFVDKSLVHGLYYYTGLIFEVYMKGIALPVAVGGRYDQLLSKFGADDAAVGFGIDMTLLAEFLQ